ncbi:retrovirus-related pol polyprotein from transposon TNT 1-94 [Tanacetum coccineum]
MGYGDYQIRNITISRVYYVEGLGHNLFSIGQFCDSDLEVAFRKHTCFVRNLEGVDLLLESQETNLHTLLIKDMMASSPICLLSKASKTKSWLWHRRLSHLNFGAINYLAKHGLVRGLSKLKFEKDHLVNGKKYILIIVDDYSWFTWVKFLASKDEAPDFIIKFLKMIQVRLNATVRNIRTNNGSEFVNQTLRDYYEHVGISHETLLTAMASEQLGSRPELQCMTPATSCSRLIPNPIPQQPFLIADAPRAVDLVDSPVSMSIDQDAPSISIPSTQDQEHSLIISHGFEESPKTPHFHDDPLHESLHEDSTSQGSSSNVRVIHIPFESLGRWTKDHPIANVIGDPSRSVSTRKQLQTDAMWCYFDAFLTSVKPKNFKQAITEPSWIDAMQEEIHKFKRLQVWELVMCLDRGKPVDATLYRGMIGSLMYLASTLSSSYIAGSDPEEDEEDPEEDPVHHPADGGDNDDNESSDDNDDDDDVEKDEEDKEKEENLAPADPFDVPTYDLVPSS